MIVKKTFSTLLMALPLMAAMTSCSDNDVAGNVGNSKSYIGFDVQASRNTRGTVMDLDALKAKKQFTIYSYITHDLADQGGTAKKSWADLFDPANNSLFSDAKQKALQNPFSGQKISYDDVEDIWKYAPLKLWPQDRNITFLSYWAGDDNEVTESGAKVATATTHDSAPLSLQLNQHTTAAKQLDFLVAVSEDYTDEKNDGKVKIVFDHITTRLSFGAKITKPIGNPDDTQFQAFVTGVKLLKKSSKLYTGATYNFGKKSKFDGTDKAGKWTYASATKATADITTDDIFLKDNTKFGLFDANHGVALDMQTVKAKDLFQKNKYLFLVPPADQTGIQEKTGGGNDDIIAEVSYSIASGNQDLDANKQLNHYTTEVALPVGTLKAGVAYRINFALNVDGNIIKIDPEVEVEDWTETEHDAAEMTVDSEAKILDAWNQLALQNKTDEKYEYYTIKVNTEMDADAEVNLTGANEFKAGAIISIEYKAGGKLENKTTGKFTLPNGYVLEKTKAGDTRNLIRKKKSTVAP